LKRPAGSRKGRLGLWTETIDERNKMNSSTLRGVTINVSLHSGPAEIGGGRIGTVKADQSRLVNLFGPPRPVRCSDGKVTKRWVFMTPRGLIEIRDYWWNRPNEWSLSAQDRKAGLWLRRFLKGFDIRSRVREYQAPLNLGD
jgi:hypothetical protein